MQLKLPATAWGDFGFFVKRQYGMVVVGRFISREK